MFEDTKYIMRTRNSQGKQTINGRTKIDKKENNFRQNATQKTKDGNYGISKYHRPLKSTL